VIIDGRTKALKKSTAKSGADYEQPEHEKYSSPRGSSSPDGKWEVLIKEHNLWIRDKDGQHLQLSKDGTDEDGYHRGDIHWSPDSTRLAALRTLKEEEHLVNVVESSPNDQLQPKLHSFKYLKPGDRVAKQRPKCLMLAKGKKYRSNRAYSTIRGESIAYVGPRTHGSLPLIITSEDIRCLE
jgi:hypothetical protein